MSSEKTRNTLINILDAISSIEETLQGIAFEDYRVNRKTMILVSNHFADIIEHLNDIPDEFRKEYPDLPWADINKLLKKLISADFGINQEVLWKASKMELRHLRKLLENIFDKERGAV